MVPNDTARRGTQHRMMPRHMTDDTAHGGSLQTPLRTADTRQNGDQCGDCNTQLYFAHMDSRL
jgi:hypothetical protein